MLVLARSVGESFVIGDDIVVTVTELKNGFVRLGVTAPKHLKVLRQELIDEDDKNTRPGGADQ